MKKISKSYEIDFGHRVWTQVKDDILSCSSITKCRRMHGHRGKIVLEMSGNVDSSGMIIDFTHLSYIKKWIDNMIDHRFLIDINDPLIRDNIIDLKVSGDSRILHNSDILNFKYIYARSVNSASSKSISYDFSNFSLRDIFHILSNTILKNVSYKMICLDNEMISVHDEWNTSFVITNFVPTAENISECIFESVSMSLPKHVKLESVIFYETPTGAASYSL